MSKPKLAIKGLPDDIWELRIEKRTEPVWRHFFSCTGVVEVSGLLMDENKGLKALPPPRTRKIEFVGDVAAGCQVEAPHEAWTEISHQDAMKSYAFVTASILQAECHVVATSSKGIVPQGAFSCCCSSTLVDVYKRAVSEDPACTVEGLMWEVEL